MSGELSLVCKTVVFLLDVYFQLNMDLKSKPFAIYKTKKISINFPLEVSKLSKLKSLKNSLSSNKHVTKQIISYVTTRTV